MRTVMKMAQPVRPAHILVVDDEEIVCRLFEAMFPGHITTVQSPELALRLLAAEAFDLVITDFRMPGLDGDQLLSQIVHRWPHIPVIVMTGYERSFGAQNALELGAADYITKPFRQQEIRDRMEAALRYSHVDASWRRGQTCLEAIEALVQAAEPDPADRLKEIGRLIAAHRRSDAHAPRPVLSGENPQAIAV